ncbi:hypothetical protein RZS08_30275, partial [Arthrospira platensis SPKY1]|nr:hypothetical protein [Arthrospira platensis SPKY1]
LILPLAPIVSAPDTDRLDNEPPVAVIFEATTAPDELTVNAPLPTLILPLPVILIAPVSDKLVAVIPPVIFAPVAVKTPAFVTINALLDDLIWLSSI